LAVFRIGVAAVLLVQAFMLTGSLLDLYGNLGVVQWRISEGVGSSPIPRIGWLESVLGPYGVSDVACVRGVFLLYITSLACLLIGWQTRVAAVLAWLTHLAMNVSGNAGIYGVDQFANIALFYCVWMPVGQALSADQMGKPRKKEASPGARLALRVLQLHLCIVYLSSGIEKASGAQWWNGEAIWRALMRPDLSIFNITWLASVPWVAKLAAWGTLAVELGYAILVWPRWTRKPMALATIGMHAGIAVTLGLVSFSALGADDRTDRLGLPGLGRAAARDRAASPGSSRGCGTTPGGLTEPGDRIHDAVETGDFSNGHHARRRGARFVLASCRATSGATLGRLSLNQRT
jgi:hypothetical protein